MKKAILYFIIACSAALLTCQEFERQLLLRTSLETQSDTLLIVNGSLLDLPAHDKIDYYGHCWSDQGEPTVNDSTTRFEFTAGPASDHGFNFLSTINDFQGNKTYYFKSYITLKSGLTSYGNTITITTGQTRGRWSKLADFWYPPKVTQLEVDEYGCGPLERREIYHNIFLNAGFYQDKVVTWSGYGMYLFSSDYQGECGISQDDYPIFGYNLWSNDLVRLLEGGTWTRNFVTLDFSQGYPIRGFGGVGIVKDGLFYLGGGTRVPATYSFNPFFDLYSASSVSIDQNGVNRDFDVYDIQNSVLLKLEPIPQPVFLTSSFLLNNKIYVVGGILALSGNDLVSNNSVMAYDIATGHWEVLNDFPGVGSIHGVSFVINDKAYVGSGFTTLRPENIGIGDDFFPEAPTNKFWEYTPQTDTWKSIADLPGAARGGAFSFAIDGAGYIGCGTPDHFTKYLKDFWRYDPAANKWTRLDDFPGDRRFGAIGISNASVGVAGFGYIIKESEPETIPRTIFKYGRDFYNIFRSSHESDLWVYDPTRN